MKKYLIPVVCTLIGFSGCFATMPAPIKDTLLIEKTDADEKKLAKIEDEIVVINQENNKIKESLKITSQKEVISSKEITSLEKEKSLLEEKKKLYAISNDTKALADVEKTMVDNQQKINLEKINREYLQARKDYEKSGIELKEAELSAKIAELNFEKAKIARAYQDRTMGEAPVDPKTGKKDDKARIDVSEYEKYLESRNEKVTQTRQYHLKVTDTFKTTISKLGFTEIDGRLYRGKIEFHENGRVKSGELVIDVIIDGITYKGGYNITFYDNKKVKSGVLARDSIIYGLSFKSLTVLIFDENGKLLNENKTESDKSDEQNKDNIRTDVNNPFIGKKYYKKDPDISIEIYFIDDQTVQKTWIMHKGKHLSKEIRNTTTFNYTISKNDNGYFFTFRSREKPFQNTNISSYSNKSLMENVNNNMLIYSLIDSNK